MNHNKQKKIEKLLSKENVTISEQTVNPKINLLEAHLNRKQLLTDSFKEEELPLSRIRIDDELIAIIPEVLARRHLVVAIELNHNQLKVAMKDPLNIVALEDIKVATQKEIIATIASEKEIISLIDEKYSSIQTKSIISQIEKQMKKINMQEENDKIQQLEQVPIVKFINHVIDTCILRGASDIHIEPFEKEIRIRYRLDGQLYEFTRLPVEVLGSMTTRIKVLAGLDIAEKRLPQDGHFSRLVNNRPISMRISFLPTIFGEKTVIRIIDGITKTLELGEIGFHPQDYEKVERLLRNPHGMILLTGPTGSGKSTTLTAAIKTLNSDHINIVTIEDPVENTIEGVNQVSINEKIGLTFYKVLRSLLRQDPDIIMLGEIRDEQTSEIAVRSALTGHLVLSTLHTNDAVSAIPRLIDMGIESYMVGDVVKGIISQRLVRKLCLNCRERHVVTDSEEKEYKVPCGTNVFKARGCTLCNYTGYKGRIAVHEVLLIDAELSEMINDKQNSKEMIKVKAVKQGMRTLMDNALSLVLEGKTTMEEMMKVAYEQ